MVAKAEQVERKENSRFVVISLSGEQWARQALYEELYCGRGDMENRIIAKSHAFPVVVSETN